MSEKRLREGRETIFERTALYLKRDFVQTWIERTTEFQSLRLKIRTLQIHHALQFWHRYLAPFLIFWKILETIPSKYSYASDISRDRAKTMPHAVKEDF